jgi:tetratricopeptide (TPR) repeat protein
VRLLQIEVGRQPTNRLVVRTLGNGLRALGRYDQSLVYYDKATALPGSDPISLYCRAMSLSNLNRYAEAEATIDEALAQAPDYIRGRVFKINILVDNHGDLPQARAELAKIPPSLQAEDVVSAAAGRLWLWSREPEKCLEALRSARDYLENGYYTGPKAYMTGLAHQMAKRPDAARNDWQLALKIVEQRQAAEPNSMLLFYWEAVLNAKLGERAEAERLLQLLRQKASGGENLPSLGEGRILLLLGRNDEALASLESEAREVTYQTLRINLRYDSVFDPLRGNPRFEALIKTAEQKK